MADVLVLGNGISRLLHERTVEEWQGEFWACNYAYLEYGHKITLLNGHANVLREAIEYRDQHGLEFKTLGRGMDVEASCPGELRKDSGTTLVAHALEQGHNVVCVGFDLGGPDLLSPGLQYQRKQSWVKRWRLILTRYGADRITFVGFDHKPYLLSGRTEYEYLHRYTQESPHIPDPEYIALHQIIYGSAGVMHGHRKVKVRFRRNDYETIMNGDVADTYLEKGKIDVVGVVRSDPIEGTNLDSVEGDMSVLDRMTDETLRKVARLAGVEAGDLNRQDLLSALRADEERRIA